jgi:hypothetical protein
MFKNGSSFSDASAAASVHSPSARRDSAAGAVMRVRSRWPFTVEAVFGEAIYAATKRQSADSQPTGPKSSSFVT